MAVSERVHVYVLGEVGDVDGSWKCGGSICRPACGILTGFVFGILKYKIF